MPVVRAAVAELDGEDVGVHLTLNAEYGSYRWGPITHAPSLLDGDGGFPRTVADVWDHADLDEVRRECQAQVERAGLWGVDVTHLDSHMGTLQLRPEFFDVYLDLAVEFGLPLRMAPASAERAAGFPFRRLAAEEGVVFPDHFVYVGGVGSRGAIDKVVSALRPGVTELYVHPAVDTAELRATGTDWEARVDDLALVASDGPLAAALASQGAHLIGWREMRDLMREG
ncbi:MAG: ChbG/HpnK family deacetylase [Microthrixaceae bacterium]